MNHLQIKNDVKKMKVTFGALFGFWQTGKKKPYVCNWIMPSKSQNVTNRMVVCTFAISCIYIFTYVKSVLADRNLYRKLFQVILNYCLFFVFLEYHWQELRALYLQHFENHRQHFATLQKFQKICIGFFIIGGTISKKMIISNP